MKLYLLFNASGLMQGWSREFKLTILPLLLFIFQKCLRQLESIRNRRHDKIMQNQWKVLMNTMTEKYLELNKAHKQICKGQSVHQFHFFYAKKLHAWKAPINDASTNVFTDQHLPCWKKQNEFIIQDLSSPSRSNMLQIAGDLNFESMQLSILPTKKTLPSHRKCGMSKTLLCRSCERDRETLNSMNWMIDFGNKHICLDYNVDYSLKELA